MSEMMKMTKMTINNNNKKYVTIKNGGNDFRKMAQIMTDAGFKMNHATARNQLMLAIETLVYHLSNSLKSRITRKNIKDLIASQDMHDDLSDVVFLAYKELELEENEKENRGSVNEQQ